ncbi:DNA-packaging protein gp3 [uncultured Caudovirales phage]|uniref:DNA-packaging protein gp3 n=1 Tax=uncultured Caudovirales phage TaxID=2100421 RepID=A0A6J5L3M9_9CAUD|nr:DNA-packaging protein gp3 [uncultured Caudovirales phage]
MANKTQPEKKKRGRPKKIPSAFDLWEAFERYRQHVKNNPFKVHDFRGKDVEEVYIEKERPLSMEGFSNYCWEKKIHAFVDDYFHNKEGRYDDFATICTRIKATIRENQIAGGMAGVFNPSITQRLNNLVEKSEVKQETTTVKQVFKIGDQIISFD